MLRAYKVEIKPTYQQIIQIRQSIGVCRWLYNQYISKNKELYELYQNGQLDKKESFMSANEFDKFVNNKLKLLDQYTWLNDCGSKARKKSICNAETAFKKFFKGESRFPKYKKKSNQDVSIYFPKNNKTDWTIERHRVKIPTLKWVRLKEFGYIPTHAKVVSGTVSEKNGRYYVSVLCEDEDFYKEMNTSEPIGIDLGIKELAICSNGMTFKNVNKTTKVKKLEKKLKREQRTLSRKYELNKSKIKKGEAIPKNINKQKLKVQKLHERLANIRTNHINNTVATIIQQKPRWVTIEDLNVKGMMKNRHLSKAIQQQKLYEFRVKLTRKCKENNIEVRVVDRWYPSSKICSKCGAVKKKLNLSERTYNCECGNVMDRDLNASINLREAITYKVA